MNGACDALAIYGNFGVPSLPYSLACSAFCNNWIGNAGFIFNKNVQFRTTLLAMLGEVGNTLLAVANAAARALC